jgi:hypothetical protein
MLSVLQESSGDLVGFSLDFSTSETLRMLCIDLFESTAKGDHTGFEYELDTRTGEFCILHERQKDVIGIRATVTQELVPSLLKTLTNPNVALKLEMTEKHYFVIDDRFDLDRVIEVPLNDSEVLI